MQNQICETFVDKSSGNYNLVFLKTLPKSKEQARDEM